MSREIYNELFEVMKARGGPYAAVDTPEFYTLMAELFTPEEAAVNNALTRKPVPAAAIAAKLNRDERDLTQILEKMANKGLCGVFVKEGGVKLWQGLPFMPGIFEYQFFSGGETERHKKIAEMIHAYKKSYEAAKGQEKIGYPRTRVIPVDKTIKAGNVIHTYDQMMTYVDKYDTVGVGTCYCRYEAKLRGEDIREMPLEVCMWFGEIAEHIIERLGGRRVSKQEAKEILDRCEEAGLIHMSRNTTDDIDFVCNCDRWHCEVVTNVLKQPKPGRVFNSGFQPVFDSDRCIACETCIDRCPPQALSLDENDGMVLNLDLCFGCGVCATGCPQEAIAMEAKPDFPTPPKNVKELVAALKASAS